MVTLQGGTVTVAFAKGAELRLAGLGVGTDPIARLEDVVDPVQIDVS